MPVPKLWQRAKVALPNPKKITTNSENFDRFPSFHTCSQAISTTFIRQIASILEPKLIDEQTGFRSVRNSSGQILNTCLYIEHGFDKLLSGSVLVELTAVYKTVRKIMLKIFDLTLDGDLTSMICKLLYSRLLIFKWSLEEAPIRVNQKHAA